MCNPAAFVLTKKDVFWSKKTDSHQNIIEEFNLIEDGVYGPNILRVEISPINRDLRIPIDQWVFKIDQDIIPKWFDKTKDEKRTRTALKKWFESKVILIGSIKISDKQIYIYDDSNVKACGNSNVKTYGNSNVKAYGNSIVRAYGNSNVIKYSKNSKIELFDNSALINRIINHQ